MSKTILITGTSSGFGKLTAMTLAEEGYRVIATMRDAKSKNASTAKELSLLPNIEVMDMDVTSDVSVEHTFHQVLLKYGQIDVLINNAGVTGAGVVEATSIDIMKGLFEINFFGVARAYQAVLPSMRKNRSGLIINISSGVGLISLPFLGPYCSTKFALEALTESIRSEVSRFNIENVTVQCGPYPTGINMKIGFNANKTEITDEYGQETQKALESFGGNMFQKITEFKMNPQAIADGVLELIKMKNGTRPHQFPIDAIAQGTDQDFINARNDSKAKWIKNYGFNI